MLRSHTPSLRSAMSIADVRLVARKNIILQKHYITYIAIINITQNKSIMYTRLYLRHYKTRSHEYCVVLIIHTEHRIIELWVKIRFMHVRWMWTVVLCSASKERFYSNAITYVFTCIGISASFTLWLHAAMMSCAKSRYACNRFFSKKNPIWRSATVH